MGTLRNSTKKAQEASESVMTEYHSAKQKGIPKWKKYLKSSNPDCYTLENHIVVRLDKVTKKNVEEALSSGDTYEDKTGHYYGVICKM